MTERAIADNSPRNPEDIRAGLLERLKKIQSRVATEDVVDELLALSQALRTERSDDLQFTGISELIDGWFDEHMPESNRSLDAVRHLIDDLISKVD